MTSKRHRTDRAAPSGTDLEGLDDAALVERAQAGERPAFDALVLRYNVKIYNLCYTKLGSVEDALDTTQDAFLKAYRAIGRFEGKSQFYTWLFRIALNCAFTKRKKRARHASTASLDRETGPTNQEVAEPRSKRAGPDAHALRSEVQEFVREAIRKLPESFAEIVLLRDIEEMAYEDIGEVLDMPIGSVKSRLHRARLLLRDRLQRVLGPEVLPEAVEPPAPGPR